jgi:hypothetical protein
VKVPPLQDVEDLIASTETVTLTRKGEDKEDKEGDEAFNFIRLKSITNLKRLVIDLGWARAADPPAVAAGAAAFA